LNLILFDRAVAKFILPNDDPRVSHIRDVLRMRPGQRFDVAAVNGPHGKATLLEDVPEGLILAFEWESSARNDLHPIRLLIGLPRPQTARKILEQAATMGVSFIHFFGAEKGEPSYADSKLWKTDEWMRHLRRGVEQAFCSFLPEVHHSRNLGAALADLPPEPRRLALDPYESHAPLAKAVQKEDKEYLVAIGPESGWAPLERDLLREAGFELLHMGKRVLRHETACVAALGILSQRWW
jgi:RsmE family RNA methyltransferase